VRVTKRNATTKVELSGGRQECSSQMWQRLMTMGTVKGMVAFGEGASPSVIITTIFHEVGVTGVHTHFHQAARYLEGGRTGNSITR
jgi:hypothetical protein